MRSCSGAGIGFAVAMVVLLQLCKWPGENVRDLHHTPSPENGRQNWWRDGNCASEREYTGSPGFLAEETDSVRFRTEHPTIAQSRWNEHVLERAYSLIPLWLPFDRAGGLLAS